MAHTSAARQISLFHSQITNRRFGDETLRILESLLVSKNVRSLIEARSSFRDFIRSEYLAILREIADKTVEQKLSVLQFFVRAFALLGDIESCLAMKYEALVLREARSGSYKWLRVSNSEWLNFAQDSIDNGFYSIARQACEKALLCIQKTDLADAKTDECFENAQIVEKMKRLKDHAVKFATSGSVQALAAEYLKKKEVEQWNICSSFSNETRCVASNLFRNGIKIRNARKLRECKKTATEIKV